MTWAARSLPRARSAALRAAATGALAVVACGYGLTAGRGRMPPGAESVFVRPLENHTTDPDAGALVAASMRAQLARRSAEGGPGAAARIEGSVDEVAFGPSSPNGATSSLTLTVSGRLLVGAKVVAEGRAVRQEDYLAGQDPLESEGRRRIALRRAAEAAARDLVERFELP